MTSVIVIFEVIVISIRLLLIIMVIFLAIYILQKTAGKLKKVVLWGLISLIPSIIYTIGRMLNIEAMFTAGKLAGLILNLLTTTFWFLAIIALNSLVNDLINQNNKNIRRQDKSIKKVNNKNRNINKGLDIKNLIKKR